MITMQNQIVKNQKGVGLVGVLVAAALVIVVALVISNFISDQNFQSVKLEVSGSCQNIANSVAEYIKKDESSLFISSYGPQSGTTRFASGLDKTDDDLDRFVFDGVATPLFMGPAPNFKMSIPNTSQSLPANWKYFNHLNIKNSTNRLIALAANGNFCCSNLDINNPNCGDIFVSETITRSGFKITEKNIEIKLAVDFRNPAGSLCTSRKLTLANLIDSKFNGTTNFAVQVTVGKGTASEQKCSAQGSVHQKADSIPSLTLMELQNQPAMCGGKGGLPSICSSASNVVYKIKTVKSIGTNCQSQCLSQIQSKTCSSIAPGTLSLFNSFSHASCTTNCLKSEPGSSFLCKVGEKNWFNGAASANTWEPCEVARVYDYDGSVIGGSRVTIQYLPENNDLTSETTTNATITLSGLRENRAYLMDVRAIDTKGNIGPSFCSTSPSSCDGGPGTNPHFVVIDGAATVGQMTDSTKHVMGTTSIDQIGRVTVITAQPKYAGALSPIAANQYQCASGAPLFTVPVGFPVPVGAFAGFISNTCTASLTNPAGATSNPACTCANGLCQSQLPVSATNGEYQFSMDIRNDCGGAVVIKSQNWCTDTNIAIGITNGGDQVFGTSPDFDSHVTYPTQATKACGIVSLCPNVSGGFTPTLGVCQNNTINWDILQHSGCLQNPGNNYCMLALDPCGRSQPTTPTKYSTVLAATTYTAPTQSTNFCFEFGGGKVGGNSCGPGSYCSAGGKCYTNCPTPPCPVNTSTATAINCGPRYCPTLNSCVGVIGVPSSTVSCTGGPVNGACGVSNGATFATAPVAQLCSAGAATAVTGLGPWNWTCVGSGGGSTVNCNALIASTNGSCGSANGTTLAAAPSGASLCNSGTASAVGGVGPWNWQCTGVNGGSNANCSAQIAGCVNCTWKRVGLGDIGCGFESCCQWVGKACPTQGALRFCCRGPAGLCNQAVAGRRQELNCLP